MCNYPVSQKFGFTGFTAPAVSTAAPVTFLPTFCLCGSGYQEKAGLMGKEQKCLVSDTGCTKAQYTIFKKHFELEISYSIIKIQTGNVKFMNIKREHRKESILQSKAM